MASKAQTFDNPPALPPTALMLAQASSECPAWLSQPYITAALREAEPILAQELSNQIATAQLFSTRALADRGVLFDKLRASLSTAVLRAIIHNSSSPQRNQNVSEYTGFVNRMSFQTMSTCLPRIASVLAEAEARVAGAEQTEAEQQAQARTPRGRLLTVYASYAASLACQRGRAGRALVYVTGEDVEDARRKTRAVEAQLLREAPSLPLDALWDEATKPVPVSTDLLRLAFDPDMVGRFDIDEGTFTEHGKAYCQRARQRIDAVHGELFPEAARPKKDF